MIFWRYKEKRFLGGSFLPSKAHISSPNTETIENSRICWLSRLKASYQFPRKNRGKLWQKPGLLDNIQQPWTVVQSKGTAWFFCFRWNVSTKPALAFSSFGHESRLPDRRVLGKFPRSQHRPSLITPPRFNVPVYSDPVKRWNFHKADWKHFCPLTGESVERLPLPDTPDIERAYQDFCESLLSATKQCFPRGHRKNYVPCWDKECETLCRSFIRAPVGTDSDRAASSLLSRLQQKKQERWEKAVNSIDFTHTSRKAWRTMEQPTGRSGRSSCLCPVSTNSIALQLVKHGAHKTAGIVSTRFVNKELSDLWKIPATVGHTIVEPFRPEMFAAALRRLKPGESPGLDSIFWKFILHAESALKF